MGGLTIAEEQRGGGVWGKWEEWEEGREGELELVCKNKKVLNMKRKKESQTRSSASCVREAED